MQLQSKHTKKIMILFLLSVFAYLIRYGFNAFLARHLSKAIYGDFSVGFKAFALASSLLLLGTNVASKRFLSKFLSANEKQSVYEYIGWNFKLVTKVFFVFLILFSIFFTLLIFLHIFDLKHIDTYHIAIYLLFFSPIGALALLIASYFNCNNNLYTASIFQNVASFFLILCMFFSAVYFLEIPLTQKNLVIIVVSAFVVLACVELFILTKKLSISAFQAVRSRITVNDQTLLWKRTAIRLILNQILFLLIVTVDLFLVEFFANHEYQVGEYAAISSIIGILWLINTSICSFLSPLISTHFETNKSFLQTAMNQAFVANGLINFIVLIGMLLLMKQVLLPFGADYYYSVTKITFSILAIGTFFGTFSKPSALVLIFSGHEREMLFLGILELVILLVLGSILTFYFGIIGTAIGTSVSMAVKTIVIMIMLKIKTGYKPAILI